ncbi:protein translocase subunit SecF [bacterium]|nr:protein translocase subunit SecF [bacterium]
MFSFVKYRKIYFTLSSLLIIGSIVSLVLFGLNLSIEFTGGSELRFEFKEAAPSSQEIEKYFEEFNLENILIRKFGERGVIVRMKEISNDVQNKIFEKLKGDERINPETVTFEEIGGLIGKETTKKAMKAIVFSIIAIILYVAFAFRKAGGPIRSWEYGIATVIALIHDVLIPVGIFSFIGHFRGIEFSIPILTALLTIFGYSVNDTVVVFDRIRENLSRHGRSEFSEVVDISLNQTLGRSVSTSLTTLFVLLALFFVGGESLRYFSLALILGIAFGTYSSIFLASPLLISWYSKKLTKRSKNA